MIWILGMGVAQVSVVGSASVRDREQVPSVMILARACPSGSCSEIGNVNTVLFSRAAHARALARSSSVPETSYMAARGL